MISKKISNLIKFNIYPIISRFFEKNVYTVHFGWLKGLKRRGGLGFIPILKMTEEQRFFLSINLRGKKVFDVGAYIGLFTLFFARSVGKNGEVVAFEPNPILCNIIKESILLNNFYNVRIMQLALGRRKKRELLIFPRLLPGVGSIENHERVRILRQGNAKAIEVNVDTIDSLIENKKVPIPDLVKIDVQGAEYDVLRGMVKTIKTHKPKILVEIHYIPYVNWKMVNLHRIAKFLIRNGYSLYHIESGKHVNLSNIQIVKPDEHLWCT